MKTFVYKKEIVDYISTISNQITPSYANRLESLGDNGYELVSTVLIGNYVIGYFKKEIPPYTP